MFFLFFQFFKHTKHQKNYYYSQMTQDSTSNGNMDADITACNWGKKSDSHKEDRTLFVCFSSCLSVYLTSQFAPLFTESKSDFL